MTASIGDQVTVTPAGYPVMGVVKNFVPLFVRGSCVDAASILVSCDAGLYRRDDVITVPVSELEPAVTS